MEVPLYLAKMGTCCWIGYGFVGLTALNRTYDFTSICPKQDRDPSKTGYSYNQSKIEMSAGDQKVFMQHQIFCRIRVMPLLSVLFK